MEYFKKLSVLTNFLYLNSLHLSVIAGISFVLCFILIKLSMPLLKKLGMVDKPSARRAHKNPTLRGGGGAIILTFLIILLCSYFLDGNLKINLVYLGIALLLLGTISFMDDAKGLPVLYRLLVHLLSSFLLLKGFLGENSLFQGELPHSLDIIITTFFLAGFLNIYNFLDGIDGISGMQSVHLSISALLLCIIRRKIIPEADFIILNSTIILGCSVAFLAFNWPPAKIFIGDVGSTFLGIIHGLNLILIATTGERLFVAAAICALYYIADGGLTLLIRIIKGEKFWLPHLNHFFQQAVRKNMSHKEVVLKIAACNSILLILAVCALYRPLMAIICAVFVVTFTLLHFQHAQFKK